jgi:hypothetical protein
MSKQALHDALQQLARELKDKPELDADDRVLLHDVRDELDALLARGASDATALRPSLEQAAARFEARHPELAGALSQVTDLLNRLGI